MPSVHPSGSFPDNIILLKTFKYPFERILTLAFIISFLILSLYGAFLGFSFFVAFSSSVSPIVISRSLRVCLVSSNALRFSRISSCFFVRVCSEWSVWKWFNHWSGDGVFVDSQVLMSSPEFFSSFQKSKGSLVAFSNSSILSWWNLCFFVSKVCL